MRALERARDDLAAGRPWKARDRLTGVLANTPADQEALELLGEIAFAAGDLPAAGRYWFLTERRGADVDAALAAFGERYRGASTQLLALPVKRPLDAYPAAARERLSQLIAASGERWLLLPRFGPPPRREPARVDRVVAPVILTALVGTWFLGLAAAIYLLVKLALSLF